MRRSPNRNVAVLAGALYLALGAVGFAVTGSAGFFAPDAGVLPGALQVNGAQNVLHLVAGAVLVAVGVAGARRARAVNPWVGVWFFVIGFVGVFLAGSPHNVLAATGTGNALHFATAVVLLVVGLGAEKRVPAASE